MKSHPQCCVIMAVLFFIVANPKVYSLVQGLLGGVVHVADSSGCPTQEGVLVHAVVFGLVCYCLCACGLM